MAVAPPRIKRSTADLRTALKEQVILLQSYCELYDGRDLKFAKPMATALRVVLHHSEHGSSKSVLQALGLRNGRYFSVANPLNPNNLISECNLLALRMSPAGSAYIPRLPSDLGLRERKPFAEWWIGPVAKSQDKRTMSRMDIVLAVADTDGGAHVDQGFSELYLSFRTGQFLGWKYGVEGQQSEYIASPQFGCIRVIAHELLLTLQKYSPWCFDSPYSAGPSSIAGA